MERIALLSMQNDSLLMGLIDKLKPWFVTHNIEHLCVSHIGELPTDSISFVASSLSSFQEVNCKRLSGNSICVCLTDKIFRALFAG